MRDRKSATRSGPGLTGLHVHITNASPGERKQQALVDILAVIAVAVAVCMVIGLIAQVLP